MKLANSSHVAQTELAALHQQVTEIRDLEQGVMIFNTRLSECVHTYKEGERTRDMIVEVGTCLTEETIGNLLAANNLLPGAATAATPHRSAAHYDQHHPVSHVTTSDEVHPTENVYRLIWQEIGAVIVRNGLFFGTLPVGVVNTPISDQLGPSEDTRNRHASLVHELNTSRPLLNIINKDHLRNR